MFVIIFILSIIFCYKSKLSIKKKIILFLSLFFTIQYIFINSNPYKNFNTNKLTILNHIPNKYKPKSELYNPNKKYKFPYILKPINCTKKSLNVSIINNNKELIDYFKNNKKKTMYQEFINTNYEVGLLYERNPLKENGKIISIIQRTFLKNHNIKLKLKDTFNEDNYINRSKLITPKLTKVINEISKKIPDFYVGRYDIRFSNLNDFKEGKNFYILEVNGNMGFDLRKNTYSFLSLYYLFRWFIVRLYYGLLNIITLNNVKIYIVYIAILNSIKYLDWELLFCID